MYTNIFIRVIELNILIFDEMFSYMIFQIDNDFLFCLLLKYLIIALQLTTLVHLMGFLIFTFISSQINGFIP